jgi:hypothetical protein
MTGLCLEPVYIRNMSSLEENIRVLFWRVPKPAFCEVLKGGRNVTEACRCEVRPPFSARLCTSAKNCVKQCEVRMTTVVVDFTIILSFLS